MGVTWLVMGRVRTLPFWGHLFKFFLLKFLLIYFLERGEKREKERERNIDV